jgi:hypothetical protein
MGDDELLRELICELNEASLVESLLLVIGVVVVLDCASELLVGVSPCFTGVLVSEMPPPPHPDNINKLDAINKTLKNNFNI